MHAGTGRMHAGTGRMHAGTGAEYLAESHLVMHLVMHGPIFALKCASGGTKPEFSLLLLQNLTKCL